MRLITRLRTASLFNTLWYHPTLLHGKGATHEQSFERLLQRLDYTPAEYQRHPHGANRWPDFHLFLDGKKQAIELKTTPSNTVCMGGTWPHPDCIYLISHTSEKTTMYMSEEGVVDLQQMTIVRGADLVTEEEKEAYTHYRTTVHGIPRVSSSTVFVQPRTNLWIKLSMEKREDWYHRVLQHVMYC